MFLPLLLFLRRRLRSLESGLHFTRWCEVLFFVGQLRAFLASAGERPARAEEEC